MTTVPEAAFVDAAQLLARRVGLRLDPSMRGRLSRSVAEEAERCGLDVITYVAALGRDTDALQGLLNRVTVQESAFFRDPTQFDALAQHVLPTLDGPLQVWSAGCANGQEPYSLAMLLDELGYVDARVCASDISTHALDRTRAARYSAREASALSPERRARYMRPAAEGFEVISDLRDRVDVEFQNLATDAPPFLPGTCPVVLCRNVLIYFSHDEVLRFLDRIADWLPPDGWLFLGYSESLWQVTDRFQLVRLGDAFVYRRRSGRSGSTARRLAPPETTVSPRTRRPASRPARVKRPAPVPAVTASSMSTQPPPASDSSVDLLLAKGEAAVDAGDFATGVAMFRRCAYLDPQQPITHLHLGLALEASGDVTAAQRAYSAARFALDSCDTASIEAVLEGYRFDELKHLLDRKLVNLP